MLPTRVPPTTAIHSYSVTTKTNSPTTYGEEECFIESLSMLTNITRQTVATQGMPTYGGITAVLVGTTSTPAISRPSSRRQFEIILLFIILTQKPDMDTTVEDPTTLGITTPFGTNDMMPSETITFSTSATTHLSSRRQHEAIASSYSNVRTTIERQTKLRAISIKPKKSDNKVNP